MTARFQSAPLDKDKDQFQIKIMELMEQVSLVEEGTAQVL
jgi:hypothetical protein